MNRPESFDWETFLLFVSERRVIPVIGRELLVLEMEGEHLLLETHLARRLAEGLGLDGGLLPPDPDLNQVALAYLERGGQRKKIYPRLKAILEEKPLPIPEPLRKLAEITDFNLFVSTTPDPLLFRAVEQARAGSVPPSLCLAYSTHAQLEDLPGEIRSLRAPCVYQLFGRASASTDYVVTEEDTLELLHSLQSETRQPPILFDALKENHLLLLGCGFTDWLARFFLRTLANQRLLPPRETSEFVIDRRSLEDAGLNLFLQHLETELFPSGNPVEFVDELHRRWRERNPVTGISAAPPAPDGRMMEPGAIFLSYASEDREEVEATRTALTEAGLDVWFDQGDLLPGDAWDQKIRDNIRRCSLFVPFLSRNAQRRYEGYFRREWKWANDRALGMDESFPFIHPIVLDDLPHGAPGIPEIFWTRHCQRFSGGRPTPEFISRAREIIRDLRLREAGYR
jgi:hypothetical protein